MKTKLTLFLFFALIHGAFAQWQHTTLASTNNVNCVLCNGSNVYAGTQYDGIFKSTDDGSTWTTVNNGLPMQFMPTVYSLGMKGSRLFAGTNGGVYYSDDNAATWTLSTLNATVSAFALVGNNILAGGYLSTDNGASWTLVNNQAYALTVNNGNAFAGNNGNYGVKISTDNGSSWTTVNNGLTGTSIYSMTSSGTTVYAGTYGAGVFKTTDNGANWSATNTGFSQFAVTLYSMGTVGSHVLAGSNEHVYMSSDNGASWTDVNTGLPAASGVAFALASNNVFAFAGTVGAGLWRRPVSELAGANGIAEKSKEEVSIYPNPTNGIFTTKTAEQSHIEILNAAGEVVLEKDLAAGKQVIDLQAAAEGIYFVKISSGNYQVVRKLVKQ